MTGQYVIQAHGIKLYYQGKTFGIMHWTASLKQAKHFKSRAAAIYAQSLHSKKSKIIKT